MLLCCCVVWVSGRCNALTEKNALIFAIDERFNAPPITLAEALTRNQAGESIEYTKVRVRGAFLTQKDLRKLTTFGGSAAFELIAPLLTDDKILILVDRGAIPASGSDPAYRLASPESTEYVGILRAHDQGQGLFDAENNADANQWYWWDLPAMLGTADAPPEAQISRFVLQLLPDPSVKVPPIASAPKTELRNNHLGYAITWFGLAATLLVMTIIFARRQLLQPSA